MRASMLIQLLEAIVWPIPRPPFWKNCVLQDTKELNRLRYCTQFAYLLIGQTRVACCVATSLCCVSKSCYSMRRHRSHLQGDRAQGVLPRTSTLFTAPEPDGAVAVSERPILGRDVKLQVRANSERAWSFRHSSPITGAQGLKAYNRQSWAVLAYLSCRKAAGQPSNHGTRPEKLPCSAFDQT
jgi:hypothetical protein